jgi:hypothetical protein
MTQISSDAQQILSGAGQGAVDYATSNAPGSKLTSGEARQLLAQYQADPNNVLSAQNITSATTAPVVRPDDLLGIRSQINSELGVDTQTTESLKAAEAARQAELGLQERLTGLRGRAVSLSKITGTQAQERDVSSNEIANLQEGARAAAARLAATKMEAESQFGIRQSEVEYKRNLITQYPGAGITFGDSTESIGNKLDKYQEEVKKDAYKDSLKEQALKLGVDTKGSTKDLEKRIKKTNKQALADAKEERDLKLEAMRADIANTKSTIAERGNKSDTFKPSDNGQVISKINQGISEGFTWEQIANTLAAKGVNVSPGSPADNELRRIHGLEPVGNNYNKSDGDVSMPNF